MIGKDDLESFGYYESYWREELDEKGKLSFSQMVEEYQKVAGQEPDPELYAGLIREEYHEWDDAYYTCKTGLDELKELSDLVYVIYGYAKARGWTLEEAVRRVHNNNMQRMLQDDGRIKRREDGKIVKNPSVPKPSLRDLV